MEIGADQMSKRIKVSGSERNIASSSDSENVTKSRRVGRFHGTMFQLKMSTLFMLRGIQEGYQFQMGNENIDIGGNFAGLIFKYQVDSLKGSQWRCRYLKAKPKQKDSFEITAVQLLTESGAFSLSKYFSFYCEFIRTSQLANHDIDDLIICTNANLKKNIDTFKKKGIELELLTENDKIFENIGKRYKIKVSKDIHLKIAGTSKVTEEKKNEINIFLEKLVFVVNVPKEEKLCEMLAGEVGQIMVEDQNQLNLLESDFESAYVLEKLLERFEGKESSWISINKAQEITRIISEHDSLRATALSIDYQKQLMEYLQFDEYAIVAMARKLKPIFFPRPKLKRIQVTRITTPSPTFTAVKVIAALNDDIISEAAKPNFERDDSYLVTSTSRLQNTVKNVG